MKVVYVAHPLGKGPDREANRHAAAAWCGWIAKTFKVAISADWIVLSGVWTEAMRELGLETDMEMVSRADEVWQVGSRVSPGMALEAARARRLGKLVRDFTGRTRAQIEAALEPHETGCRCPECAGESCTFCGVGPEWCRCSVNDGEGP